MKNMKKIVVTFALPQEQVVLKAGAYEFIPVVTGIGKARSALVTMKAVMTHRPELVLNVGTAGTLRHLVGDILVCRHFFDRDFSKTQLPGISYDCRAEGAVPFRLPSVVGGVETWERPMLPVMSSTWKLSPSSRYVRKSMCPSFR